MFYYDLDDLPSDILPEHLVVISVDDFQKAIRTRENGKFLLDADKHFLVVPTEKEAKNHPIIRPIYENSQLKANTFLLKNTQNDNDNDNYYLPYEILAEQNIYNQMLSFRILCQYLGAKEVKLIMTESLQEYTSTNASIAAKIKTWTANIGANFEKDSNADRSISSTYNFEGGVANFTKAKEFMNKGIFKENRDIQAFYDSATNTENPIKSTKVTITMNNNISNQLQSFINADIPIFETIFNTEMKTQMKKLQSLKIEYEVIF